MCTAAIAAAAGAPPWAVVAVLTRMFPKVVRTDEPENESADVEHRE